MHFSSIIFPDCLLEAGRSGNIKKKDLIFIGSVLLLGLILLFGFKLLETAKGTGVTYAKVIYRDELILMIDLDTFAYKLYDTQYSDKVDVGLADSGIFYVPGTVTTDMEELYQVDEYARSNGIIGVKLLVSGGKIQVLYQESPHDICQLQRPTDSSLEPLVCLPNELVVQVVTDMSAGEFIPDSVLE